MSFLTQVAAARDALKLHGRVSIRALGRELELEGEALDEVIGGLVEIQQVARVEGKALVWVGADSPGNEDPQGRAAPAIGP